MSSGVLRYSVEAVSGDAIQRAGNRFSDRLSIELSREDAHHVVTLFADDGALGDELIAAFRKELMDQTLRERIRAETAATRNAVLALAFAPLVEQ